VANIREEGPEDNFSDSIDRPSSLPENLDEQIAGLSNNEILSAIERLQTSDVDPAFTLPLTEEQVAEQDLNEAFASDRAEDDIEALVSGLDSMEVDPPSAGSEADASVVQEAENYVLTATPEGDDRSVLISRLMSTVMERTGWRGPANEAQGAQLPAADAAEDNIPVVDMADLEAADRVPTGVEAQIAALEQSKAEIEQREIARYLDEDLDEAQVGAMLKSIDEQHGAIDGQIGTLRVGRDEVPMEVEAPGDGEAMPSHGNLQEAANQPPADFSGGVSDDQINAAYDAAMEQRQPRGAEDRTGEAEARPINQSNFSSENPFQNDRFRPSVLVEEANRAAAEGRFAEVPSANPPRSPERADYSGGVSDDQMNAAYDAAMPSALAQAANRAAAEGRFERADAPSASQQDAAADAQMNAAYDDALEKNPERFQRAGADSANDTSRGQKRTAEGAAEGEPSAKAARDGDELDLTDSDARGQKRDLESGAAHERAFKAQRVEGAAIADSEDGIATSDIGADGNVQALRVTADEGLAGQKRNADAAARDEPPAKMPRNEEELDITDADGRGQKRGLEGEAAQERAFKAPRVEGVAVAGGEDGIATSDIAAGSNVRALHVTADEALAIEAAPPSEMARSGSVSSGSGQDYVEMDEARHAAGQEYLERDPARLETGQKRAAEGAAEGENPAKAARVDDGVAAAEGRMAEAPVVDMNDVAAEAPVVSMDYIEAGPKRPPEDAAEGEPSAKMARAESSGSAHEFAHGDDEEEVHGYDISHIGDHHQSAEAEGRPGAVDANQTDIPENQQGLSDHEPEPSQEISDYEWEPDQASQPSHVSGTDDEDDKRRVRSAGAPSADESDVMYDSEPGVFSGQRPLTIETVASQEIPENQQGLPESEQRAMEGVRGADGSESSRHAHSEHAPSHVSGSVDERDGAQPSARVENSHESIESFRSSEPNGAGHLPGEAAAASESGMPDRHGKMGHLSSSEAVNAPEAEPSSAGGHPARHQPEDRQDREPRPPAHTLDERSREYGR
jgi:predicted secreted protein